jgi:Na+-driven multidrug efflux pump
VGAAFTVLFALKNETLTMYFLTGEQSAKAEILGYAKAYMEVMIWGMLPFAVSSAYASTLRESGQTVVPMIASVAAVVINLFLNWILIFGKLGAPAMGVVGAAIATVISRFAEMGIDVVWAHTHADRVLFTKGVFRSFRIRSTLLQDIVLRSLPLFVNEFLWSTGTSVITQVYSTKGLVVVAALNIGFVLNDLFQMAAFSIGNTIGIIVGQQLGAGQTDKAVDTDRKLLAFSLVIVTVCAGLMCACASLFPAMYNTTPEVKKLAAQLIRVMSAVMPFSTLAHGSYFTLRSGGKTIVTFLFDSCFMWTANIPAAWCAAHLTPFGILAVYAISNSTDIIKCIIGCTLVHKRVWVNNLAKANEA